MEPGHEDREYQPNPVEWETLREASMEPGHEDREYPPAPQPPRKFLQASMEPGHEDREYSMTTIEWRTALAPQWSPVMKTGNTWTMGQGILQN